MSSVTSKEQEVPAEMITADVDATEMQQNNTIGNETVEKCCLGTLKRYKSSEI